MLPAIVSKFLKAVFKKREERSSRSAAVDSNPEQVKPFLDHLEDLRWTIVKVVVTVVTAMILAFVWHAEIFQLLELPLKWNGMDPREVLITREIISPFMAALSLAFYAGIVVSFPLLVIFIGEFVLPALTPKEKRMAMPAVIVGFLLFLAGVWFCFSYIVPAVVKFMAEFAQKSGFKVQYEVKSYFGFTAMMCIAFGLLCQLPVVMVTLHTIGVISYQWIRSTRMYAIVGIIALCVVVSPAPDIPSLMAFSLPIIVLYEICIWVIWALDRRKARFEAAEAARLDRPYENDPHEPID